MRLQLVDVARQHGAHVVLDGVSLQIDPRTRLGLVGANGSGKSTLLRILAGIEQPDSGTVVRQPATLTAGYLPQEHAIRAGETIVEWLGRRTGVAAAEHALGASAEQLAAGLDVADDYTAALDRFLALGGSDLESRAATVLAELGLPVEHDRPVERLSGGEVARLALAAILLSRHDVLLLDEPTNDLDFDGLDRLERFVGSVKAALVVVSHDRAFLDRTVTRIAEIEPGRSRVREWAGGWTEFAAARNAARTRGFARFDEAQERRRELAALLAQRRNDARAGGAMADRRGTHALMTKVRQAERLLERTDALEKPFEPWELRLTFPTAPRAGGTTVARLEGAVGSRGGFTLGPIDLDIAQGERLAVTGRNGSGKSTLLAMLLGELELDSGRRVIGRATVVGTIAQERLDHGDLVLLAVLREETGLPEVDLRTLLAKFGLGAEHVGRRWSDLSPGERTRAHLASLQAGKANLLVLDEPTNHLDLEAVEQLEAALRSYAGALVVVSHDRRFLEAIEPTRRVELG